VGEGGQGEFIIPENKMGQFAGLSALQAEVAGLRRDISVVLPLTMRDAVLAAR
jgi:hypothetical protein